MGNSVNKAKEGLTNRMSMRRRRNPNEETYTQADIYRKFQNIPKLTQEELKIIQLSWNGMKRKKDIVSMNKSSSH